MENLTLISGSAFRLPVAPTCRARAGDEQNRDNTGGGARRFVPGKGPRLLIVDDQALNRKVLQHQLHLLGLDCAQAASGKEALDLLAGKHFDIVITDCFMPSMDGLELTRRLRSLEAAGRPRTAIIAFTANALQGTAERCYEAGADSYLTKPLSIGQLSDTLHRWYDAGGESDSTHTTPPALERSPSNVEPAPIDAALLASILGDDDPNILKRTVREFLTAWQESLSSLHQLLRDRDADGLAEAAHAAKGIAHYGAAHRVIDHCARLERLAQAHQWPEAASVFESLKQETKRIQDHLDGWR